MDVKQSLMLFFPGDTAQNKELLEKNLSHTQPAETKNKKTIWWSNWINLCLKLVTGPLFEQTKPPPVSEYSYVSSEKVAFNTPSVKPSSSYCGHHKLGGLVWERSAELLHVFSLASSKSGIFHPNVFTLPYSLSNKYKNLTYFCGT